MEAYSTGYNGAWNTVTLSYHLYAFPLCLETPFQSSPRDTGLSTSLQGELSSFARLPKPLLAYA